MKIILHFYINEDYTTIESSEIEIESNEMTVKELKKVISDTHQINSSEQILTIKYLGLKIITLSDNFPLSFFYIRKNSEIYVDNIKKYKNKTPTEISKMNIKQNKMIQNVNNKNNKNNNNYDYDTINQDKIIELDEEDEDNEDEKDNNETDNNMYNYLMTYKELNPDFIIKNALYLIRDDRFIDFIQYLEFNKKIFVNVKDIVNKKNNWNALHYSCYYGNREVTAFLLTYNNNGDNIHELINSVTKDNYTPLHIACHKSYTDVVTILLGYLKDIDINIVNNKNETCLHIACKKNSVKIVSMLIASNANLFLRDNNNKRPIELTTDNNIKKLLVKSMIKSPDFKNEDLDNINIDISLYKNSCFTPPKPPKTIGHLEKRGVIIPFYSRIFVEVDPILGTFKKYKSKHNYPEKCFDLTNLNDINVCKKENTDSSEEFYFSIISQKNEIFKVKSKTARDKWISRINESVVYYKYWKKFQKKNQNIEGYIKNQKNETEMIDEKNGEVQLIENGDITQIKNKSNKSKKSIIINKENKDNIILIKEKDNNDSINNNIINNLIADEKRAASIIKEINIKKEGKEIQQKEQNNLNESKTFTKKGKKKINNDKSVGIKFEDYIILNVLGTGSFGRVFKVKLKDDSSDKVYAMKVINKNLLMRKKQLKYAVGESSILKKCDCPFIVKLYYSFQTLENLYMVEEYCPGGDLQYHLKINLFEEEDAKFYIAEVILAIEYLHNLNIIYRDLKPENILIGEDNHVVLADFGLAKEGIEGKGVSQSFCGSPAYLPPETLNLKGVGRSGDIYGIGAVLYEMISGTPPFFANDITVLFNKIKNSKIVLHQYFSDDLKDLLRKMLEKDPDKRFGIFDKKEIKKHRFFKGINWEKLKKKEMMPPCDLMKQKRDNDKFFDVNKTKAKKNMKFTDVDYTKDNKYTRRVKQFTFIRNNIENEE